MNDKGKAGEDYAARALSGPGREILARNYRSPYGEIDIIASDGESICFIEVKTRRRGSMVGAAQSVTPQKQKRIIMTAAVYLQENGSRFASLQPRFDVFCVETGADGGITGHDYLEGAFDCGAYGASF